MKKVIILLLFCVSLPAFAQGDAPAQHKTAASSGNYTIGIGPIGNFYLTSRRPEMDPGVGALIYFDYRWSPELSTTATVMMLSQGGKDREAAEGTIIFMGIPTFDIKYYFLTNPSRWDPYASVGIGYYVVTSGSVNRGVASGLGAQSGGGFDYYFTSKVSLGLAGHFRSIAMLGSGATGSFPLSLSGQFGFHF